MIFVVFVGLVQFTFLLSLNDFVTISTCRVCKSVRLSRMHDIFFAVSFVFSQTPYKYCVFFYPKKSTYFCYAFSNLITRVIVHLFTGITQHSLDDGN